MATPAQLSKQLERIRKIALALPEATEEFTWEDINFRVRNKIFVFPGQGGSITVKAEREELPALLEDPRVRPAPYLARGGWVRLEFGATKVDWDEVRELITSSYCLIAPKTLARQVTRDEVRTAPPVGTVVARAARSAAARGSQVSR